MYGDWLLSFRFHDGVRVLERFRIVYNPVCITESKFKYFFTIYCRHGKWFYPIAYFYLLINFKNIKGPTYMYFYILLFICYYFSHLTVLFSVTWLFLVLSLVFLLLFFNIYFMFHSVKVRTLQMLLSISEVQQLFIFRIEMLFSDYGPVVGNLFYVGSYLHMIFTKWCPLFYSEYIERKILFKMKILLIL